ncbi:hypothetical protein PUR61_05435 [Streptomyces sp. BE20]|nr:hypothetical protein [Streptomyces sp. BE20]MEE1821641.1 hypothetical protein [Streptomyces sp. BE20]
MVGLGLTAGSEEDLRDLLKEVRARVAVPIEPDPSTRPGHSLACGR